jgi:hypothetical protein
MIINEIGEGVKGKRQRRNSREEKKGKKKKRKSILVLLLQGVFSRRRHLVHISQR